MTETGWLASAQRSQGLRLLVLSFLALLLLIPVGMVRDVVAERQARRDEAVANVAASWGGAQRIGGPRIVVPYRAEWTELLPGGGVRSGQSRESASFLPEVLTGSGDLTAETLHRGIFEIPVYRTKLAFEGSFAPPSFAELPVPSERIDWEGAELVFDLTEARAIDGATIAWNGERRELQPGSAAGGAIHVPLALLAKQGGAFEIELELRGSESLSFVPAGNATRIALRSNWASPSFAGAWVPTARDVTASGFAATWGITALARGLPQRWLSPSAPEKELDAAAFGVRLLSPVDTYRMAERSAKYAVLFIALTFATLWLFEVLTRTPLHSVQYLLVGAALCLFFLLELSLAEHLGFGLAYSLACGGVVGLIGAYAWAVLRTAGRAAIVAGIVTSLYGYLYVLLTTEDYALLAGALGLFVALAAIMWLTRRVDWRDAGAKSTPPVGAPSSV